MTPGAIHEHWRGKEVIAIDTNASRVACVFRLTPLEPVEEEIPAFHKIVAALDDASVFSFTSRRSISTNAAMCHRIILAFAVGVVIRVWRPQCPQHLSRDASRQVERDAQEDDARQVGGERRSAGVVAAVRHAGARAGR